MIDEDAFGVLFSYYELEDDEYGSDERADFVQRFEAFERAALGVVQSLELPGDPHVVCLGHALYVEFRDDELANDLLRSLRQASSRLAAAGFVNASGAIPVVCLHDILNRVREVALHGVCHGAAMALASA